MASKKHHHGQHSASQADAGGGTASQLIASQPVVAAKSDHLDWQGQLAFVVVVAAAIGGIVWLGIKSFRGIKGFAKRGDFKQADYSIPHCKFAKTEDGFSVTFHRLPKWITKIDPATMPPLIGLLYAAPFIAGLAFFFLRATFYPSRIAVTREAVIINGTKMRRADFGGFFVNHTRAPSRLTLNEEEKDAQIGYRYGRERTVLPGLWKESQAQDFLSALNQELSTTPMEGDEHRPDPDALREAARSVAF